MPAINVNSADISPTHDHIIRLAPPLVIRDDEIEECLGIIGRSLEEAASGEAADLPA